LGATLVLAATLASTPGFPNHVVDASTARPPTRVDTLRARSDHDLRPALWHEPTDIERRDLFFGPGGARHQPRGAFTFIKEDLNGSHPKFELRSDDGVRWIAKLGTEAQPETAATRLVWAVGYAADEDYFVDKISVSGVPAAVHRGPKLIDADGAMHGVRLKRKSDGRVNVGEWAWRQNPFSGTQQFNGLRVLMAVINNWDLKDVNNTMYDPKLAGQSGQDERVFEVSDLGSSFGSTGLERTDHSNGDLQTYRRTAFITHVTADEVDFRVPRLPDGIVFANAPEFFRRVHLLWIGRNVPRADARWLGRLLAQLSANQIRDAFRAAGYGPEDVQGFTAVLEASIRQLNEL